MNNVNLSLQEKLPVLPMIKSEFSGKNKYFKTGTYYHESKHFSILKKFISK